MKLKMFLLAAVIIFAFCACQEPNVPKQPENSTDTIPKDTIPQDTIVLPEDTIPEPIPNPISDMETDYSPLNPSGLPTLRINTNGQSVNSKDIWVSGVDYQIFNKDRVLIFSGETEIKGRGNSTWDMPKKPYSLKLVQKKAILGMPSHKRWALLANYADKTLLRTEIGYKLGKIFDNMAWSPSAAQVNFYFNDEYQGVYQISEAIKIDANRVNVNEISTSNPNGGFLVECDWRRGEIYNFPSNHSGYVWFNCSDPDKNLDAIIPGLGISLFSKIKNKILDVENILYSENTNNFNAKAAVIDMDSFIDYFFVNEIVKNVDAQFALSVFMYYDPQTQKIHLGPIWDFDLGCGNSNYADSQYATGWWIKDSPWFERLFYHTDFKALVKQRWAEKKLQVLDLLNFIDQRTAYIDKAQQQNFKKWTILDKYVWPNSWVTGTYEGEIAQTKSWLLQRINWLDGAINGL